MYLVIACLAICLALPVRVRAQGPDIVPAREPARPITPNVNPAMNAAQGQYTLTGSVPSGEPTSEVLPLSLTQALKMALQYNLGSILTGEQIRLAQGTRSRIRSDLLPTITTNLSETRRQVNLAAFGFNEFPGMKSIVGPFNVFDVRVSLSQSILDLRALNQTRAENENIKAAEFTNKDTRDTVVLLCGSLYLDAVAGKSRIDAARAQLNTAQSLFQLAQDRKQAGVAAGIDVLRAQVQLQEQQQRMIVAENDFAKEKLSLARAIGLPLGQEFTLTDSISYAAAPVLTTEMALQQAYENRADYRGAGARVRAAESLKKAAEAERLPSVALNGDYGDIGSSPTSSHGTFSVAANVRIPIFQGGRVRGDVLQADAVLQQRKAELQELRGRIYYEVRTAFLDVKAADERVQVAKSAVELARQQVVQSQDRFSAGVTNNVEVVQAQEALATAEENYIASLNAHSLAKGVLARALGVAESAYEQFLRGK